MNGCMEGADVAGLRALRACFTTYAEELARTTGLLARELAASPWQGSDAAGFRQVWADRHQRALVLACAALREAAAALGHNADEQEQASRASGPQSAASLAAAVADGLAAVSVWSVGRPDPARAKAWWDRLTETERAEVICEDPELIGGLDGLPGRVRDLANRALLPERITAALAAHAARPGDHGVRQDLDGLLALRAVTEAHPDYQLLLLDDSGHPLKAAVADGDVDAVSTLAVLVPGTAATVAGLSGGLKRLGAIRRWVRRSDPETPYAGVFWLGYDAPDAVVGADRIGTAAEAFVREQSPAGLVDDVFHGESWVGDLVHDGGDDQDALNARFAREGAGPLARFGDGLRANGGPGLRLVADAHSYGGVVAGLAAQRTDAFDALITNGAPGVGTRRLADLHLRDGLFVNEAQGSDQPWATRLSHVVTATGTGPAVDLGAVVGLVTDTVDFVPDTEHVDPLQRFGGDPSGIAGAHLLDNRAGDVIGADSGSHHLSAPHGHSSYFDVGTTSAANAAAVITRRPVGAKLP